jgi:hypothetical protein
MKYLQIGTLVRRKTRGFWVRRKVRVLKMGKSVPSGAVANTRILDAPTHGRAERQPTARSLIAGDGTSVALPLSRESRSEASAPLPVLAAISRLATLRYRVTLC